jgi:hypothetical protein
MFLISLNLYGEEGFSNGKFKKSYWYSLCILDLFMFDIQETRESRNSKMMLISLSIHHSEKMFYNNQQTIAIDGDIVYVVDTALNKVFAFKRIL